jgi:poly-gamma-glutamate system protein
MAIHRRGKLGVYRLWVTAILALLILAGVETSKTLLKDPLFDKKIEAARLMQKSLAVIKEERLRLGIPISLDDDPNETGIIGKDYTDLTTTLGSLSSKRTSTNPNFAGIIVEMLSKAGVKAGDGVAISFSASFPALNVATLSAVHVLGVKPVIISSVGASTYGANLPRITWLDMERVLRDHRVFPYASSASSLGGIVETQGGLDGKGIEEGLEAVRRNGIPFLDERGLRTILRDIDARLAIYEKELGMKKPAAFINTGGALTSLGNVSGSRILPTGLLLKVPASKDPGQGIIARMVERGVPVIHLLNTRRIARQYGLPVDPIPLPPIPDGRVMKPQKHSFPLALVGFIFLSVVIAKSRVLKSIQFHPHLS